MRGRLQEEYSSALKLYLAKKDEETRSRPNEIGRRALSEGLGVLDMVEIHHRALSDAITSVPAARQNGSLLKAAAEFLDEALMPFEMTHRGFREVTDTLQRVITFANMLCHELRTPLTSIIASAGMLQELSQVQPDSVEGKLLANIAQGGAILKVRTDDLADIVGFMSGNLRVKKAPLSPAPLLRKVCQRLEPLASQAGVKVNVLVPQDLPVVNADPGRLEQVVSNLLQTAIKYGSDGGAIDVRASAAKRGLIIEVQDYGKGITRLDQQWVFQPYFRADSRKEGVSGLGLGLAICQQIVHAHGGSIRFAGEKGKGSLFTVVLPWGKRAGRGGGRTS